MDIRIQINQDEVTISLNKGMTTADLFKEVEQILHVRNELVTGIEVDQKNYSYAEFLSLKGSLTDFSFHFLTKDILSYAHLIIQDIKSKISSLSSWKGDVNLVAHNKDSLIEDLKVLTQNLDVLSNALYVPFVYVFKQGFFLAEDWRILQNDILFFEDNIRNNGLIQERFIQSTITVLERVGSIYLEQMILVFQVLYSYDKVYLQEGFKNHVAEIQEDLRLVLELANQVPAYFHTGKEQQAIKSLEKVILIYEFISHIVLRASLFNLIDVETIGDIQESIQADITSINDAIGQEDTITACDIFEYDYIPKIKQLVTLLPSHANGNKD